MTEPTVNVRVSIWTGGDSSTRLELEVNEVEFALLERLQRMSHEVLWVTEL